VKQRIIYATKIDHDRLSDLIKTGTGSEKDQPHLRELRQELEKARVVDPRDIPGDVVTMNSRVRLKDLETDDEVIYTLVYPKDADVEEGKISVLAPIGTAILGYRAGATISWKVPAGLRKLLIEEILYQPEAAGDFHL
jgi:regulator of nucleoside diphosphate kinase